MRRRLSQRSFDDLFDGPDTKRSTAERGNSTLPQQALYMMNSPFIERASQAFAARLLAEENAPEDRIQLAFQYAYGRPASRLEIERFMGYILERGRYARKWPIGDTSPNPENSAHWTSFCRILLMSNEFVFID